MKKLFMILASVATLFAFTSCGDDKPDGPVIIQGDKYYVTGTATVFEGQNVANQLTATTALDSGKCTDTTLKETDVILSNYVYLNAGTINIELNKDGKSTVYGGAKSADLYVDGLETNAVVGTYYALTDGGAAVTIADAGMYFIAYNINLKELAVVKANWGLIGDGVSDWSTEVTLDTPTYADGIVTYTKSDVIIKNNGYKFRFGGGWGITLRLSADATINVFSDITGSLASGENALTETFANMLSGGANLDGKEGVYTVTVQYIINQNLYQAKAVKTGEYKSPYDKDLYMIGNCYGGWDWAKEDNYVKMINTGVDGKFWILAYLNATDDNGTCGLKFFPGTNWDNGFGANVEVVAADGKYTKGDKDIHIAESGVYQIVVDETVDGYAITVEKPVIYLLGDVIGGVWGADAFVDANKFTVDDEAGTIASPAFANDGNLRMCMRNEFLDDENWWKAEFNVIDGVLVYRGADSKDLPAVAVTAGQKVTINLKDGTGVIE